MAQSFKSMALGAAGLGAGYILSRIGPKTAREAELGETFKRAAGEQLGGFAEKHSLGLAKAMANAFGIARFCAFVLVAISAITEYGQPAGKPVHPKAGP